MKLLLDSGNSRLKWALASDAGELVEEGAREDAALPDEALRPAVGEIVLASVRGGDYHDRLVDWAERARPGGLRVLSTPAARGGLVNAYADPARLGVDRWLAMLGAWRRLASGFLVVDAGTAVTIDLVDDAGRHRGGAILPGAPMMSDALVSRAAGIRPRPGDAGPAFPAADTGGAVAAGTAMAVRGAVREALSAARREGVVGPLVVTGGGAGLLAEAFAGEGERVERIATLVFEGMLEML